MSFLIIAHRGDSEHHPENTLPAFEAAIRAGADMIELDIALAADGAFVVIHDDTLSRTTTADGFVGHLSSRELTRLDASRWFRDNDRKFRVPALERVLDSMKREAPGVARVLGRTPSAARVPTLDQALEAIGSRVPINIEIKPFFPLHQSGRMQAALSRLTTQLHERRLAGQVILSSSNFYLLEYCRELSREIRLGIIYRHPLTDFDPVYVARAFRAHSVHPYYRQVSRRFVEVLHAAGLKVYPYTVNKAERLREMRGLGVDGVFTDNPAAARRALESAGGKRPAAGAARRSKARTGNRRDP